jgi:hypothetical protein
MPIFRHPITFLSSMCKCLCTFLFPTYFSIHYIKLKIFFSSYLLHANKTC